MKTRGLSLLNQPIKPSRRRFFQAVAAALALVFATQVVDNLAGIQGRPDRDEDWVGTWSASPELGVRELNNQTFRLITHTTVGGDVVRARFSNTFGTRNLTIGGARIALRAGGAAIVPETDRVLTFGGSASTIIPPGALVVSDPVRFLVPSQSDLAVSFYLPGLVSPPGTGHDGFLQTNYITPPGAGDFTSNRDGTPFTIAITRWLFLSGIEVQNSRVTDAIVAFGGGATDGCCGTRDSNNRYPDYLFRRLALAPGNREIAVLNQGIVGNRLLHDFPRDTFVFGPNGLARFDRDVLAQTGVKYIIVEIGINDIGQSGEFDLPQEEVSAEQIIAGYKQLITRAHAKGLKIYGATLKPFEGTIYPGYYTPEGEAKRQVINQWIRTSGAFDAVFDFDAALRDPSHPTRLLPAYDRGDHLNLNDAGHEAMADAIDLKLFK